MMTNAPKDADDRLACVSVHVDLLLLAIPPVYQFRSALLWVSTAILVCLPALLAIDFGGVLRWSQYIAAIAVLLAAAVSLAGLFDSSASTMLSQHKLLIPLGIFVAFVWFQTIELSPGFVSILSGGSYEAYMDWTKGLLPGELRPTSFAVSISPSDTAHAAAFLTVMLALVFASSLAFHSRSRLVVLLSAIALAGLSVAVVGVFRKLNPDADLWFIQPKTTAFGGFVNRNNAALMLNLGLGASFGLLSWRMMVLHSVEFDDPEFEFNDLIALVSDRESFIGIVSAAGCTAGLLVNGSRGGVVAALVGILFAFGYVRPRRGKISIPVLLVVIAISVAVLTVPLKLDLESISRLQLLSEKADTIQNDGRLQHWQDGLRASLAYLPLGSGLSTYRFAYLPFQNQSPGAWFTHADNLWLELLVETGFVGIFVVLTFLLMVMISLRRLGESVDPLDQGIRVAAWYGLGAIVASQWFDFGLLLPANLITVLLLATAVVSRDTANGGPAIWRHLTAEHRQAGPEASGDSLPSPAGGTESPQVMGVKLNPAWFS
ncbi:MAG: O-antigen ligase family protein, partial [Planctomycetota bacterium]